METFKIENGQAVETIEKRTSADEFLLGLYQDRNFAVNEIARFEEQKQKFIALVAEFDKRIAACETELGEELTASLKEASPYIKTEK